MFITVLAPEIIIMAAASDLKLARKHHKKLRAWAEKDGIPWTLTHTYYANMGGFVLRGLNNLGQEDGGEAVRHPYHLCAQDLEVLRQKAIISALPDVRELDITDRCKTDGFVKAIAMLQIIWSSTQIVVRFALNLTVSPLEMSVVAFTVCTLIIYGLY